MGFDIGKWLALSQQILPAILMAKGVSDEHIGQVVSLVGSAEKALGPGSGSEKLQSVLNGLGSSMQLAGASPTHIQNVQGLVTSGLALGIGTVNTVHGWHQNEVAAA